MFRFIFGDAKFWFAIIICWFNDFTGAIKVSVVSYYNSTVAYPFVVQSSGSE
jgi:hypothetical protein